MTHQRPEGLRAAITRPLSAAAAAGLFGMTMYGCTEASSSPAPVLSAPVLPTTTLSSPIAQPVVFAASVAQETGFTYEDSRQDGDALVLTGVRYVLDGTTVSAERLRVEAPGTGPNEAVTARRIAAYGVVIESADGEAAEAADATEGDTEPSGALTISAATVTRIAEITVDAPVYAQPPSVGADAAPSERRQSAAALLGALSFGTLRADGIAFEAEGATGTVQAFEAAGYAEARLGQVQASGIEFAAPDGTAGLREALAGAPGLAKFVASPLGRMLTSTNERTQIERIVWNGLDLSGPRAALAAGQAPGLDADDVVFGDLVLEGQTSVVGGTVAQRVAATRVTGVRFQGVVPTDAVITTEGAVTDMNAYAAAAGDEAVALIEARGLDQVEGRSEARLRYDPETGRFTATSDAQMDGLYGMRMQLDVGGLSEIVSGLTGDAAEAGADGADLVGEIERFGAVGEDLTLNALSISVRDEQLLELGFALAALGSDRSAAALRQQAVSTVTLGALQGAAVSPRVPDYAAAISSFLSDGGTLTIRMAPEGGLTAAGAQEALSASPAGILDAADLTITRTP